MAETVDDYDFSTGDAGASHTYPMEAGQIRVGGYMTVKDRPAKVSYYFIICLCLTLSSNC